MPVLDNARHERFAQEVAQGKSQVEAYEIAGFVPNDGNAAKLAGRAEVQARVKEITGEAAEKAGVNVERVLGELAKLGFSNMLDYVSVDNGEPQVNLAAMTRDQAAALAEITINTRTERGSGEKPDAELKSVKFKLSDKRAALVDLGKHLGMFKERVEHTGKDGGPIETSANPRELARAVLSMLREAETAK